MKKKCFFYLCSKISVSPDDIATSNCYFFHINIIIINFTFFYNASLTLHSIRLNLLIYIISYFRSRFSRSSKDSKDSPRSARRSEERETGRGSPRSAARKERDKESSKERDKELHNGTKMTLDLNGSVMKDHHPSSGPLQEHQSKTSKLASISQSSKQTSNSSSMTGIPHHNQPQQTGVGTTPGSPVAPATGIPTPAAAVKGSAKAIPTNNLNPHHSSP